MVTGKWARLFRAHPLHGNSGGEASDGVGKRGGLRVVYNHIPDFRVLFILDVYGKDEAEDLTSGEKKELQTLARQLVDELRERNKRGKL